MVDNFNLPELASSLSHTQQRTKKQKLYCDFSCPVQRPRKNIVFGMKVLFSCEDRGGESIPYGEYSTAAAPTKGRTFFGPLKKITPWAFKHIISLKCVTERYTL